MRVLWFSFLRLFFQWRHQFLIIGNQPGGVVFSVCWYAGVTWGLAANLMIIHYDHSWIRELAGTVFIADGGSVCTEWPRRPTYQPALIFLHPAPVLVGAAVLHSPAIREFFSEFLAEKKLTMQFLFYEWYLILSNTTSLFHLSCVHFLFKENYHNLLNRIYFLKIVYLNIFPRLLYTACFTFLFHLSFTYLIVSR